MLQKQGAVPDDDLGALINMVQDEQWRKYEAPAKIYTNGMNNEMSIYISVAAWLAPPDGGT